MTERLKIGKLDAARRQLETAILLYFNSADPVSIHTLAAAAQGILQHLGSHESSPMLLERSLAQIPKELADEIRTSIRKPQNFFKHADQDPDEVIEFAPALTEFTLLDAVAKYLELTGELTLMLRAYEKWFPVLHPHYWTHTSKCDLVNQAHQELGMLSRMEFLTQFMANSLPLVGGGAQPPASTGRPASPSAR
jgi:hypothetical protein